MKSEELRVLVLQYLKDAGQLETMQFQRCLDGVNRLLELRITNAPRGTARLFGHNRSDDMQLADVIWGLIFERVLIPGQGREGWPFFSISDHGQKVITEMKPVPYDPDGFLKRLRVDSPGIHDTVIRYMQEAIGTFRTGNYLASAVMLGAASEKLFDELSDSLPKTIADDGKGKATAVKMKNGKMKDLLNAIVGWCRNNRAHLPGAWAGDEQTDDIEQVATLIRRRRNEAGHPMDPPSEVSHEQMYAYLMAFQEYCKNLHMLKQWADDHPRTI